MDSYNTELFWELVGYVSKDPCTAEPGGPHCLCLPCRARENYEAYLRHRQEAEAVPKKRVVFGFEDDIPDEGWWDLCQGVVDNFSKQFDAATERVLQEIGPERVAHIAYPASPESSARRTIVGHAGELLGEVWIEWPDTRSDKREITVRGRYRVK